MKNGCVGDTAPERISGSGAEAFVEICKWAQGCDQPKSTLTWRCSIEGAWTYELSDSTFACSGGKKLLSLGMSVSPRVKEKGCQRGWGESRVWRPSRRG